MRSLLQKLLFYYCAIAAFLITISTIFTSQTIGPVIFATLFLPVTAYFIIEFFKQMHAVFSPKPVEGSDTNSGPKKGEIVIIAAIFLLLLGLGIRNIYAQQLNSGSTAPSPTPKGLIFNVAPTPTPSPTIKITITDGSASINIRQKPSIYAVKIGTAKEGDTFAFISKDNGWYLIKFDDKEGYVSAKYAVEETK